jgi:hypothetical protein
VWACRKQNKAVNDCLTEFSNNAALREELRRKHAKEFPTAVVGYRSDEQDREASE